MTWETAENRPPDQQAPQEPIRVLFISHDTSLFGAQRTLLTLLSAIDRRVCSPLLLLPYDGPMTSAVAELGIPVFFKKLVHWVPGSFVSTRRRRLRHLYHFLQTLNQRCRGIERLIEDQSVDLVYTNTVTCVEGAIAAKRKHKPHVWHIHEHILRNSELAPLLPYRFYCAVVEFLSKSIIFCSRTLASDYPRLSKKASIVNNGLPVPPVRDKVSTRARVMKEFNIGDNAKLVAIVAALHPRKDHMTFLAAAEQVARKIEDVNFLIVGTGTENYTNILRKRISALQLVSRISLLGWRDNVHDLLAAVDVLVISSEQESFGLTAIEALAMETPVVATRCGGPEEILLDGETGILVPVKNPSELADAITRLLRDPKLAHRLGVRGRNYVIEHFGVERYVQSVQRVILETAATRSKRQPHIDAKEV